MEGVYAFAEGDRVVDQSVDMIVKRRSQGYYSRVYMGPDRMQPVRERGAQTIDNEAYDWVALRTLRPDLLAQPAAYQRFVEESLIWIGLWDHPNILNAQFISRINGAPYLHLDYAEKGSLRDVLTGDPTLSLDQRMYWAQQIAAGLVALHTPDPSLGRRAAIVHRDLKPENILLLGGPTAQIADLGLAYILDSAEQPPSAQQTTRADDAPPFHNKTEYSGEIGGRSGTPAYMAPELWDRLAPITPAVDVYALAVMISELLADRHALLDLTPGFQRPAPVWKLAHLTGAPRSLRQRVPQLPPEVEDIYLRCLSKDARDRPDASEVLTILQDAAPGLGFARYEARKAADRSIENLHIFWHNRAAACEVFERFSEALDAIDRALALDPASYSANIRRANILTRLGRLDEAHTIIDYQHSRRVPAESRLPKRLQHRPPYLAQSYRRWLQSVELASIQLSMAQGFGDQVARQVNALFQTDRSLIQTLGGDDEGRRAPNPDAPHREDAHNPKLTNFAERLGPGMFFHVGQRLTDYANIDLRAERVASGGFGQVVMGLDNISGQWQAIKALRPDLYAAQGVAGDAPNALAAQQARLRAGFLREALTWVGLWPHPNILPAHFVTEINGQLWLVLEYAEQGSLRDLFESTQRQGGWLRPTTSLQLAQEIAAGLVELHTPAPEFLRADPLVHRDLKPENVLLSHEYARITDFGLSKAVQEATADLPPTAGNRAQGDGIQKPGAGDMAPPQGQAPYSPIADPVVSTVLGVEETVASPAERAHLDPARGAATQAYLTQRGVALGTPAYMAPEQWTDAAAAGTPADAYAFGVLLVELFTSQHPLLPLDRPHTLDAWRAAHLTATPHKLAALGLEARWQQEAQADGRAWTPAEAQAAGQATAALDQLCAELMAKAPAARPTMAEASARLRQIALGLGQPPYSPPDLLLRNPENEQRYWLNCAIAYFNFGLYEEALRRNDRALVLAPENSAVLLNRGNILLQLARHEEALALYSQALYALPLDDVARRKGVLNNRAALLSQLGQFADAEDAYNQALALAPESADVWRNRALNELAWAKAELERGRNAEARLHFTWGERNADQAMKLSPDDPVAPRLLMELRQRLAQMDDRDHPKGEDKNE